MKEALDLTNQLVVRRTSPIPLYHQVAEQLEEAIRSGRLAPGERIENELSLVEKSGLSRPTIRQAIDVLVRKGLLIRKRGVGTEVSATGLKRRMELSSLFEDLLASGRAPSTVVIAYRPINEGGAVPNAFDQVDSGRLLYIERLRLADAEPLALMRNWIPAKFAQFSREELETGSLYALLRASGNFPDTAKQRFSAVEATSKQARLLNIGATRPLLSMSRTAFDANGKVIEYAEHLYVGKSYAVEVTVSAH